MLSPGVKGESGGRECERTGPVPAPQGYLNQMRVSRHKDRDNKNHKDLHELLNIDLNITLPAPSLVKPIPVTCILSILPICINVSLYPF